MNHYSDRGAHDPARGNLRSAGKLSYALFDFDIAVVFDPQAERSKCRLPMARVFEGTWPQPHWDRVEGQPDFDPFAFDVGCLGLLFRLWIQVRASNAATFSLLGDQNYCRASQATFPFLRRYSIA